MLVIGICVTPPATFFFGKATTASNSSVATINLRSGRHDLIAAIALAPPAGGGSRASASRTDDNYDVLADGVVIGRIFKVRLDGRTPWMWTPASGHHEDRTPTHGYEATREAAMAAFAKSWRRQ